MMCGIAGFCDLRKQSDEVILKKMTDRLVHRGPDDSGYTFRETSSSQIGLGHRRLSILDLSPSGHQPMRFNHFEIVFNGEIYNFLEVRKELEQLGYQFTSHSDTEVILKGFDKWGIDVVHRFVGMFAFALYDNSANKLYLVRDRVGVKPLYYYHANSTLLFASELKAFHAHPAFRPALDQAALTTYFQFGYSISPRTIFQRTFQVNPGSYIVFDIARNLHSEIRYWNVESYYTKHSRLPDEEVLDQLEPLLISSANYRMVADVPVGLFLSGGYDSSTIAALLQKDRTDKIKTFTIGFKEEQFNEAPHAKKVAEYLGTDHTEHYCSMDDAIAMVPEMPHFFDEPFADPSSIPTMLVSDLARKSVTVALSADGGDELFGGYPKYLQALKYRNVQSAVPRLLTTPARHLYDLVAPAVLSKQPLSKYRTTSNKISELMKGRSVIDFARINVQQFEEQSLRKLLIHGAKNEDNDFYDNKGFESFDPLNALLLLDFKVFLPDDLLVKVDRSTMRVSLEGREPLLDHRLIEFMGKVEPKSKLGPGGDTTKYYLKQVTHKYLPKQMLDRPKMGFTPPLAQWMRGPLRDHVMQYLDKNRIKSQDILHLPVIERIKNDFYSLNYDKAAKKLWNVLMFQMWYDKWIGS